MKKTIVIIAILAMLLAGGCDLLEPSAFETESYSVELPAGFGEESEGNYLKESNSMFVDTRYYLNEANMDIDAMGRIIVLYEFYAEDIIEINEVEIDGHDALQVQYKTLATGLDDIHYYYLGVVNLIKLDTVVLVVDGYVAMTESEGIDATISSSDLETLVGIADTIKITDAGYDDHYATPEKIDADGRTLNLSDNWVENVEGDNGFYDFGYFSLFASVDTYMYYEFDIYNDENANNLDYIAQDAQAYDEYTYYDTKSIDSETADIYKYEGLDMEDGTYAYGVLAVSEHYWVDLYFYIYDDDFKFSDETVDNIIEYMINIQ